MTSVGENMEKQERLWVFGKNVKYAENIMEVP